MPLVNFRKKIRLVSFDFRQNFEVRTYAEPNFFWEISKNFLFQNLHYGPIRWVPRGFSKFWFFIVKICILIRDFWDIFEIYCMRMLSIHGTDFIEWVSILGTDFIAHWAYEERISAHAQPAVKCELFYMYNLCWAYAERILSHTEHTRNEFHRMLSILGTWAY